MSALVGCLALCCYIYIYIWFFLLVTKSYCLFLDVFCVLFAVSFLRFTYICIPLTQNYAYYVLSIHRSLFTVGGLLFAVLCFLVFGKWPDWITDWHTKCYLYCREKLSHLELIGKKWFTTFTKYENMTLGKII